MNQIIDHNDVLEWSVLNNSKVFDEKAILGLHAIFSVQKSMDSLFWCVQVIDDWLSIVQCSCSEDIDIVMLTHIGQKFEAIGSNIEFELISFMGMSNISFFFLVKY